MAPQFEDVSHWSVSRFFRDVVRAQPDGRLLFRSGQVNWLVGGLLAISLLTTPISSHLAWFHVVAFFLTPFMGAMWFLRSMPPPQLTALEGKWRTPFRRRGDTLLQLVPALLPWLVLLKSHVR